MGAPSNSSAAMPSATALPWMRRWARIWTRAAAALARVHARHRQRHRLQQLDDRLLKDIGLSRADAEREWRRAFWRA